MHAMSNVLYLDEHHHIGEAEIGVDSSHTSKQDSGTDPPGLERNCADDNDDLGKPS